MEKKFTTFSLEPSVFFENLREGLGLGIQYTVVSHQHDIFEPVDPAAASLQLNTNNAEETSKWGYDYVSINAFYDFGECGVSFAKFHPFVFLRWDVPAKLLVVNRVPRTHRVCFGIEFAF